MARMVRRRQKVGVCRFEANFEVKEADVAHNKKDVEVNGVKKSQEGVECVPTVLPKMSSM